MLEFNFTLFEYLYLQLKCCIKIAKVMFHFDHIIKQNVNSRNYVKQRTFALQMKEFIQLECFSHP